MKICLRKSWTEWAEYCQISEEHCLGARFRKRLVRNMSSEEFHEELQIDNKGVINLKGKEINFLFQKENTLWLRRTKLSL